MKRKRRCDPIDDAELRDLVLTDAFGRSIRVHRTLLIDSSDYFANILSQHNLKEIQLDENYLIELMQYLYNNESDQQQSNHFEQPIEYDSIGSASDSNVVCGDLEILMQLLALSRKYSFRQLYSNIISEINYKLCPQTVIAIYTLAIELDFQELHKTTRLMILSWLPQLQKSEAFYKLSEKDIIDIFTSEATDVDNECKLNALSAWWSRNKEADMTHLWVKLITSTSN